MALAGGNHRQHFTHWALRHVHWKSRGIPRIINNLCDKALLAAFIRDSHEVTYWDARRASRDVERLTN
jgi:general secretion pathway protein A